MSNTTKVVIAKGGTDEKTVEIQAILIPDLWHITRDIRTNGNIAHREEAADAIVHCWHLCHDLRRHIQESP